VCGVSECDREASTMRTPRATRGCRANAVKRSLMQWQFVVSHFFASDLLIQALQSCPQVYCSIICYCTVHEGARSGVVG
jgi:hypothetical protein